MDKSKLENDLNKINCINVNDFSLKHTIESGQFFLYEIDKEKKEYIIIHNDILFKVWQDRDILYYQGINKKKLIKFFSLDINLKEKTKDFKEDKYLYEALKKYYGLRIIRQDLWQCIISFVCSSASNIEKIKKNMFLLSKYFGEKKELTFKIPKKENLKIFNTIGENNFYTFPKPGTLNSIDKLKKCKVGFRAKYIYQINKYIIENPNFLTDLKKETNYQKAKKKLMSLPGIGEKVADCICLFSLNHKEAFPIDTWVKKIIEELYLEKKVKNILEIKNYINNNFKKEKGIKQQYLFHYMRNK